MFRGVFFPSRIPQTLPLERIPGQGDKEAVKFLRFFLVGRNTVGENGMFLKGQRVRKGEAALNITPGRLT